MKVLLIVPNAIGKYYKPTSPHVGIAYLAAFLMKNEIAVEVIDLRLDSKIEKLFDKIQNFSPDLIGITCASREYDIAYGIISQIKDNYSTPVVIGGPHPSVIQEKILLESKADYAVIGEGEYTLLDLVTGKDLENINGLVWRDNGKIVKNPKRELIEDLDSLPFPAYEKFELEKYLDNKIPIVSSRGCPFRCTYCSIKLIMGNRFRARSPENVVDEIEYWHNKGYNYFTFTDDNFTCDINRAIRICELIIERGLKIKWDLRNGIRVNRVNKELLEKMKRAGCFYLAYGIESGHPEVLKNIKKGITTKQVRNAVKLAKDVGIKVGGFFLIGAPGDTFERFRYTLNFAKSLRLNEAMFYNIVPYPGTELQKWVSKNAKFLYPPEIYLNEISYDAHEPVFVTDDFSKEERRLAHELGEVYTMKLFFKSEFGTVLGPIFYGFWKNKLIRKYGLNAGLRFWAFTRKLKTRIKS